MRFIRSHVLRGFLLIVIGGVLLLHPSGVLAITELAYSAWPVAPILICPRYFELLTRGRAPGGRPEPNFGERSLDRWTHH